MDLDEDDYHDPNTYRLLAGQAASPIHRNGEQNKQIWVV